MEGIGVMALSTVLYFLSSVLFAYRGMWPLAGVQFFYAAANCCLMAAAIKLVK